LRVVRHGRSRSRGTPQDRSGSTISSTNRGLIHEPLWIEPSGQSAQTS
jgi:hypothetical protein